MKRTLIPTPLWKIAALSCFVLLAAPACEDDEPVPRDSGPIDGAAMEASTGDLTGEGVTPGDLTADGPLPGDLAADGPLPGDLTADGPLPGDLAADGPLPNDLLPVDMIPDQPYSQSYLPGGGGYNMGWRFRP